MGGGFAKWTRAWGVGILFILLVSILSSSLHSFFAPSDMLLGATFSHKYAEELGLDWPQVYLATLDDLKVKKLRIPMYWSDIEPNQNERNYSSFDWMMTEAAKRDVKVTLAIGIKVPRWPECFIPDWAEGTSQNELSVNFSSFLEETVIRYKNNPALERWQVENEPFFPFGICETPDPQRIFAELETVRTLDPNHPIQMTASGEQSLWMVSAIPADVLGVSMYRWAWNPVFGFVPIPMPEIGYALQRKLASPFTDTVIVSELQAEPWFPGVWDKTDLSRLETYYTIFSTVDLLEHIEIARRIGVDEAYIWGIEWWYYVKEHGDSRLWDTGKVLFAK